MNRSKLAKQPVRTLTAADLRAVTGGEGTTTTTTTTTTDKATGQRTGQRQHG